MALELTDSNFNELILNSDKLTVVDFWAPWCGPCKVLGPVIDELATEYDSKVVIGKVNVDDNPEMSSHFGIRNIPTILFIKGGKIIDIQVGMAPKASLITKINSHI